MAIFNKKQEIYLLSFNNLRKKILKREKILKIHSFSKIKDFGRFKYHKYKNSLHLLHLIFEQKKPSLLFHGFWQLKKFLIASEIENQSKIFNDYI